MELTERCNNACIHCYINRPENDAKAQGREMETTFVIDILRQAAELGCRSTRFTGGEPLLRSDFSEIYLAARRLGMTVLLFTNARLITPSLAELFTQFPPGEPVEITVYGMCPETYDAVACVRGAYAEFHRGIGLLLEHGVRFVVKGMHLPPNRGERDEFEAWASTLPGMEGRHRYLDVLDLRARRDDPGKNRRIKLLRPTPEESVAHQPRTPEYLAEISSFCARFMRPPGNGLFSCGAGRTIAIDSYGYAQMCLLLRHPETVVDLRTTTLRQVLTETFPDLRKVTASNPGYAERCASCFLKGFCEQCPARSWMEHGTLDTPVEYLCELAHAHARALGLIGDDERAWRVDNWEDRVRGLTSQG